MVPQGFGPQTGLVLGCRVCCWRRRQQQARLTARRRQAARRCRSMVSCTWLACGVCVDSWVCVQRSSAAAWRAACLERLALQSTVGIFLPGWLALWNGLRGLCAWRMGNWVAKGAVGGGGGGGRVGMCAVGGRCGFLGRANCVPVCSCMGQPLPANFCVLFPGQDSSGFDCVYLFALLCAVCIGAGSMCVAVCAWFCVCVVCREGQGGACVVGVAAALDEMPCRFEVRATHYINAPSLLGVCASCG